jgi:hypothetical protein
MRATPISILALALAASACGGKSAGAPNGSGAAQCPDSQSHCLTAPACTFDDARQCMMCRCSPPGPFEPNDYTPQGPPKGP